MMRRRGSVWIADHFGCAENPGVLITASAAEAAYVDTYLGALFKRTGFYFYAYPSAFPAPPGVRPRNYRRLGVRACCSSQARTPRSIDGTRA